MINIKCCFSKHCTLAHLRSVHWVAKVASVCICVCVCILCSCMCACYKLLLCARSIYLFMCVHVCVHVTNYCRVRAVYGPGGIHCVCMATYVHLFFASELYGPQPYQTHIMRLKVLCSRTLVSTYYPSVSYVVCKLSVLSLQCRMFILCTVHL